MLNEYDLMCLHWMARRYADGRSSYSPGLFNGIARKLLSSGVELKRPHFARDGMGRDFDGLTDAEVNEALEDMPRGFSPEPDERLADAIDALRQCVGVLEMMRDDVVEPYFNARHKALTHAHAFLGDGPSKEVDRQDD